MSCQACGSHLHYANDPSCPGPRIEMPMPYPPCSLCGCYGHYAPECHLAVPALTLPEVKVSLVIVPSAEERMVIILGEIQIQLKKMTEELQTIKRKIR